MLSANGEAVVLRVGVVIATVGRPDECADIVRHLLNQSISPSCIVISSVSAADLPRDLPTSVNVVLGSKGLCAQRNRGIEAVRADCDVVVFYDDDFIPSARAIEGIRQVFQSDDGIVGATGLVLLDGVGKGGVSLEEAEAAVSRYDQHAAERRVDEVDIVTAYGCNMAFRVSAMQNVAFDETLPLYGWQEDVDYAGQISRYGRVVATTRFAGVHRGVSSGRTPGGKLGFSQIVNPVYLVRKGTMRWSHAVRIIFGNLMANHGRMLFPETHVDRLGRARGNWLGLLHLMSGRLDPRKMLEIN
jgi:GT2 family glycosyltransferase